MQQALARLPRTSCLPFKWIPPCGDMFLLLRPSPSFFFFSFSILFSPHPFFIFIFCWQFDEHFARLRIGVGATTADDMPLLQEELRRPGYRTSYVLGKFSHEQQKFLSANNVLGRACEAIDTWLVKDMNKCMNVVNHPDAQPGPLT
eukprot:TRINITY_DN4131_c0_g1_i2.p2 TRINITY_DN4131_c0_g1~~TRINITY_DN4131_c0_g1_i2.p2  ORF type:complete len:146 (+),score=28.47 TRINITY_DN4131_c0_g1_i2:146-583(+)